MASRETYTAAEVDAAVAALSDPERLRHAQDVVTHAAPSLQHLMGVALEEGGWFGDAHREQLAQAAAVQDPVEREQAVAALIAEETRLGMLVGVTVGFELARELASRRDDEPPEAGT